MVQLWSIFALALVASSVKAAPTTHTKRIAQVIADSTKKWEAACVRTSPYSPSLFSVLTMFSFSQTKAGGAEKCNQIAVDSFGTLLAAPGPCEQQDAADKMIDLAKTLKNDPDMIKFAQIFAQQPRNSVSILLHMSISLYLSRLRSPTQCPLHTVKTNPKTASSKAYSNANSLVPHHSRPTLKAAHLPVGRRLTQLGHVLRTRMGR